jgi:hypothetical protein
MLDALYWDQVKSRRITTNILTTINLSLVIDPRYVFGIGTFSREPI